MVGAKFGITVKDCGVAFGGEAIFVRIAAYTANALESEVERLGFEAGTGEEGDEERAEATVYMERKLAFLGEAGKG